MSDFDQRLDVARAAGRRLDEAAAVSLNGPRSGPVARNGQAQGGWLKTLFGGSGRARPESAADRAAYLLMCQSVVAAHVIARSETANFPRASGAAEFELRRAALSAEDGRSPRNTARASSAQDLRTVFDRPRPKAGMVANLAHFLR